MASKKNMARAGNTGRYENRRHYSTLSLLDANAYEYAPRGMVIKATAILAVILFAAFVIGQVTA